MSTATFQAIHATLQTYFDGLYYSDTQRLRQVFHPEALYACATETPALILRMPAYFPIVDARPSPASRAEARTDHVQSIELVGPCTAMAKVTCSILPKHFIDLLTLIQVNGEWKIISKVFHYALENADSGLGKT